MGDPLARSSPIWTESHAQLSAKTAVVSGKLIHLNEDREQWRGEASPVRNLLK